jgi:hypothetical protein
MTMPIFKVPVAIEKTDESFVVVRLEADTELEAEKEAIKFIREKSTASSFNSAVREAFDHVCLGDSSYTVTGIDRDVDNVDLYDVDFNLVDEEEE